MDKQAKYNAYLQYIAGYTILEPWQVQCTYKGTTKCKYVLRFDCVKINTVKSLLVKNISEVVIPLKGSQ
jgi:hypothetical protein